MSAAASGQVSSHVCEGDGEDCSPGTCGKVPRAPEKRRGLTPLTCPRCGEEHVLTITCRALPWLTAPASTPKP